MESNQTKVFQACLTSADLIHIGVATSGLGMLIEDGKITAQDMDMSDDELERFLIGLRATDMKLEFIMKGIEDELKAGKEDPKSYS